MEYSGFRVTHDGVKATNKNIYEMTNMKPHTPKR